jgi:ubiquinone/menaquinone biosynthesis C-methylase UbiE
LPETDFNTLKTQMRATWMLGDFGVIARYTAKTAEEFISHLPIQRGARVLDVACGTGNTAIPEARAGALVTGVDIASNLLEQARERAAEERLEITFTEGDAERLSYPDASFDAVVTMFGAMFAPRPELVAAEMLRVCRPGGLIAMANWTPAGFVGKMFAATAKHAAPPAGLPAPVLWGDEATVRQRFGGAIKSLTCRRVMAEFRFPFPPSEVLNLFRQYFGPTQAAFSRLDAPGQTALAADLVQMWEKHNEASDGTTLVRGEYLEVQAVR